MQIANTEAEFFLIRGLFGHGKVCQSSSRPPKGALLLPVDQILDLPLVPLMIPHRIHKATRKREWSAATRLTPRRRLLAVTVDFISSDVCVQSRRRERNISSRHDRSLEYSKQTSADFCIRVEGSSRVEHHFLLVNSKLELLRLSL